MMMLVKTFPNGTTVTSVKGCKDYKYLTCSAAGGICHYSHSFDNAISFAEVFEAYYKVSKRQNYESS